MISLGRGGDLGLITRVLRMSRPFWTHIILFFLVSLLATPLALIGPLPLKIAADALVGEEAVPDFIDALVPSALKSSETRVLLLAAGLFVLIALLRQSQELARTLLYTFIGERLVFTMRSMLFGRVQRLSLSYHDTRGTADSLYRIQYDATSVQSLAIEGVIPFLTSSFTLVSMVYVLILLDWQIAAVALIAAPVMLLLTQAYRRRLRERAREVKRVESSAMGVIQEVLGALRVVKAFGQEEREGGRFEEQARQGVSSRIGLSATEGFFGLLIGLVTAGTGAIVLYIGARHVQANTLTLGELLLVMGYLSQLYDPLKNASKRIGKMQASLAGAERAFALLDEEPEVVERENARPLDRAAGEIAFQYVSFGYDSDAPVLSGLSFKLSPGQRLGVYGATGAGKTTLISLLTRLYDPDEGSILLDGVDIADYRVADVRSQFAIVLQEPVLFSTTIRENISYARPSASLQEIETAARAASIHDFIAGLPDGYETVVGERGMRLSGGERQRVALARAFLKDAPILILDEPTSSVDSATEATIIQAMERLMAGRTTIMIAHRLTTLDKCDFWLELEAGGEGVVRHQPPSGASHPETPARPTDDHVSQPHPAVQAWERLGGSAETVTTIKDRAKSSVYRLGGAGAGSVIAKHSRRGVALKESYIYSQILAQVPGRKLAYYGLLDDGASDRTWLFLEEVHGEEFSSRNPEHLAAAARWFAGLHRFAPMTSAAFDLPRRDVAYYLRLSQLARRTVEETIDNPALAGEYRRTLEEILACAAAFEDNASRLEEVAQLIPATLVHGDLKPKNARVLSDGQATVFLPYDWAQAGWGSPAADLCKVDRDVYWQQSQAWGGDLDRDDIEQVAEFGRAIWALSAIPGEAPSLAQPWVDKTMSKMWDYRAKLAAFVEAAGWKA